MDNKKPPDNNILRGIGGLLCNIKLGGLLSYSRQSGKTESTKAQMEQLIKTLKTVDEAGDTTMSNAYPIDGEITYSDHTTVSTPWMAKWFNSSSDSIIPHRDIMGVSIPDEMFDVTHLILSHPSSNIIKAVAGNMTYWMCDILCSNPMKTGPHCEILEKGAAWFLNPDILPSLVPIMIDSPSGPPSVCFRFLMKGTSTSPENIYILISPKYWSNPTTSKEILSLLSGKMGTSHKCTVNYLDEKPNPLHKFTIFMNQACIDHMTSIGIDKMTPQIFNVELPFQNMKDSYTAYEDPTNSTVNLMTTHEITSEDVRIGQYFVNLPLFRYYDNGNNYGRLDTTYGVTKIVPKKEAVSGSAANSCASSYIDGRVNVIRKVGDIWTLGDIHIITGVAYDQKIHPLKYTIPFVPWSGSGSGRYTPGGSGGSGGSGAYPSPYTEWTAQEVLATFNDKTFPVSKIEFTTPPAAGETITIPYVSSLTNTDIEQKWTWDYNGNVIPSSNTENNDKQEPDIKEDKSGYIKTN
jgi:hypothetical protein